jgi:sec-independent protein translocase protein TatA
MIGDLFDSPWKVLILAVVILVLFGSRKLPDAARSLGKSMRILKTEIHDLHDEHDERDTPVAAAHTGTVPPPPPAQITQHQDQVEQLQRQIDELRRQAPAAEPQQAHAEAQQTPQAG